MICRWWTTRTVSNELVGATVYYGAIDVNYSWKVSKANTGSTAILKPSPLIFTTINTSINFERLDMNTKSKTEHFVPKGEIIVNRSSEWRAIPWSLLNRVLYNFISTHATLPQTNSGLSFILCLPSSFVALNHWITSASRPGNHSTISYACVSIWVYTWGKLRKNGTWK